MDLSNTSEIGTSEVSEIQLKRVDIQLHGSVLLLQNSFSHQQRSSLEDNISVSVMLQYNRK